MLPYFQGGVFITSYRLCEVLLVGVPSHIGRVGHIVHITGVSRHSTC